MAFPGWGSGGGGGGALSRGARVVGVHCRPRHRGFRRRSCQRPRPSTPSTVGFRTPFRLHREHRERFPRLAPGALSVELAVVLAAVLAQIPLFRGFARFARRRARCDAPVAAPGLTQRLPNRGARDWRIREECALLETRMPEPARGGVRAAGDDAPARSRGYHHVRHAPSDR